MAAVVCFPDPACPSSRLSNSKRLRRPAQVNPHLHLPDPGPTPGGSSSTGSFILGGNTLCCRPREGVSTSRLSCPGLSRASRLVGHGFAFLIEMAGTSPAMTLNMWREPTVPIRSSPRPSLRSLRELRRARVRRSAEREGGKRDPVLCLWLWVPACAGISGGGYVHSDLEAERINSPSRHKSPGRNNPSTRPPCFSACRPPT